MTSKLCKEVVGGLSTTEIASEEVSGRAGGGGGFSAAVEMGRRLLVAARGGDTGAVLELMAKGAPFSADWLGTSPLHLAAQHAHADTCAVLLRSGVSRDLRTKVERTPLHLAAYHGHAHVVQLLLDHDAQVDCRDMLRMTPLHWAVERGHSAAADALLRHGADPHALSKFHKTPLSLAKQRRRQDIVRLIESALEDREAALSVHTLVNEHMTEEPAHNENIQNFESIVHKIKETKPSIQSKEEEQKSPKSNTTEDGGGGGGNEGEAAQLLRRHGITLLPTDEGTTVLNAIQSGRTVVLSDAGKLMLKESEGGGGTEATPKRPAAGGPKGVVVNATPPKTAIKIFTLNNKLIALPKQNTLQPLNKIINPQLKQVKIVQLSPEAKMLGGSKARGLPLKAKEKAPRQAVKIIMNKTNFHKLMANADASIVSTIDSQISESVSPAAETKTLEEDVEEILRVKEEFLVRCSTKYLRTHALAARRALVALKAQLDHYKATLHQYQQHQQ